MEKLYTVSKKRPGTDCGSDHEFLIAKFRLRLKKVGKTTRPFRYDLNLMFLPHHIEVLVSLHYNCIFISVLAARLELLRLSFSPVYS